LCQAIGAPKKRQKPINVEIISNSLYDSLRNTKERGNRLETILHSFNASSGNAMKVSSSSNLNRRIHTDNLYRVIVCPCSLGITIKLKKLGVSVIYDDKITPINKSGEKLSIAPAMRLTKLTGIKLINASGINEKLIRRADICTGKMISGIGRLSRTGNAPHDNNLFGHISIISDQKDILN
jgi:hypothetical protein